MRKYEKGAGDGGYMMVPLYRANGDRGRWWRLEELATKFLPKEGKRTEKDLVGLDEGYVWPVGGRGGWWLVREGAEVVVEMKIGEVREGFSFFLDSIGQHAN